MQNRFAAVFCGLIISSSVLHAATWELVPKVGYQMNMARDLSGPNDTSLKFENESLIGLSLGYMNKENGQLELSWSRSESKARIDQVGGAPAREFDVDIEQFLMNGLYMFDSGGYQPFLLIGVGAAHYAATGNYADTTKFSFAVGGGAKWLWNDYIGLRFDALWNPTLAPDGSDFFCDPNGNCANIESNSFISRRFPLLNSFQFTAGLLLRY